MGKDKLRDDDHVLSDIDESPVKKKKNKTRRRKHVSRSNNDPEHEVNDANLNLYRPRCKNIGSLFVENEVFKKYLKCDSIPKFTYPTRSIDKVELEPIPSDFLPPLTNKPIFFPVYNERGEVNYVQRVCGHRELFEKRKRIKLLKDKEKEDSFKAANPKKTFSQMLIENEKRRRHHSHQDRKHKESDSQNKKHTHSHKKRKHDDHKIRHKTREDRQTKEKSRGRSKEMKRKPLIHHENHRNSEKKVRHNQRESKVKIKRTQMKSEKHDKCTSTSSNKRGVRKADAASSAIKFLSDVKIQDDKIKYRKHKEPDFSKQSQLHPKPRQDVAQRNVMPIPINTNKQAKPEKTTARPKLFSSSKDEQDAKMYEKATRALSPPLPDMNNNFIPDKPNSAGDKLRIVASPNNFGRTITLMDQSLQHKNNCVKLDISDSNSDHSYEDGDKRNMLQRHLSTIRRKLISLVKLRDKVSIKQIVPDENANFIVQDDEEILPSMSETPVPHIAINMQHNNNYSEKYTVEKIAEHFRTQPVQVFTAATFPKKTGNHPHSRKRHSAASSMKSVRVTGGLHPKAKDVTSKTVQKPKKERSKKNSGPKPAAVDITNFESYYKYVFGAPIKEQQERDSEWLDLSLTDEEEENKTVKSLGKTTPFWMIPDISFESQQLVTDLKPLYWMCLLTGRQFFYTVPNLIKGHMEFATKRTRIIPFFFSAFILWAVLVLTFQSYFSINFSEAANNTGPEDQSVLIEQLEITKYQETWLLIMGNLTFVAVWSVLVILRDGQLIVHYLNCWCPALAEMETSGSVGIRKVAYHNLFAWAVISGIILLCFFLEFPGNVRGTAGLIALLVLRAIFPDIRLKDQVEFEYFQYTGLAIILYVLFCSRMLFALMQSVALIIRNSAQMWNFKFALAFNQLLLTNRGHMQRISMRLPLKKFFTHHRIMSALVKIYGTTFGVPIMIYLIVQVGMITYVLVHLFNFKAGDVKDYGGTHEVTYQFYSREKGKVLKEGDWTTIKIPYYHAPVEEISTSLFVLSVVIFDFMFTTEVISSATQSFFDGFEFVRRTNLILCKTTHQRRLIQSLLWSFSDTDPTVVSASNYFQISRPTIVAGFGTAISFFSLIIQLQSEKKIVPIRFKGCAEFKDQITEIEERCRLRN